MVWRLRIFLIKQLPLNDNENNFDEKFNNNNYEETVRKLHDCGWENGYLTFADVAMFGHGYGFSQYPQLYYQQLEKYQLLPCKYLRNFEGDSGYKNNKIKMVNRLGR